jgi:hypothetical protein
MEVDMKYNKVEYIKALILTKPDLSDDDIKQGFGDRIVEMQGDALPIEGLIQAARKELACTKEEDSL